MKDEDARRVRRRGPIVERRVLGSVTVAALVIGGAVAAMQLLTDPTIYEVTERMKADDQTLRDLLASRGDEPEYLIAENAVVRDSDVGTAALLNDPYDYDAASGNDPTSALGVLGGDDLGRLRQLIPEEHARMNIGYGGPIDANAVLENNFISGNGVRARLEELLEMGVLVDGQRVRVGAFEDRQSLPYAVPRDRAVALHTELERPRVSSDGDLVHLAITLVGQRGERPRRPHVDVRIVLDVSGSMARDKLRHALVAARRLVARLRPSDRIGIITYETEAHLVLPPGRVGSGAAARRALSTIEAGGGTNLEAGLRLALEHPPERRRPDDVGLVLLVSDGRATDGVISPRVLGGLARSLFDEHGVLTTTIGVGRDFDENTMLTIAREGSGSYHFIRDAADIDDVLTDELDERAQAVAQALRIRVELAPGVEVSKVYGSRALSGSERTKVRTTELATDARVAEELGIAADRAEEATGIRMHLPTFRRGDDHVILFQLAVPPGTRGSDLDIARVYLDYKDLVRDRNGHEESEVRARRVADRREVIASTSREVKRIVLSFQAAEALAHASRLMDRSEQHLAQAVLEERADVLRAAAHRWDDAQLARDGAMLERYAQLVSHAWVDLDRSDRDELAKVMSSYAARRMR